MIDINRKYKTKSGYPVELITANGRGLHPVVGYIDDDESLSVWDSNGENCSYGESEYDLVEVSPWDNYKINDPVVVRFLPNAIWHNRFFAGVYNGKATVYTGGTNSWSNITKNTQVCWECRKPTEEELKACHM